ncbi:MAG: MFS transporter [Symbiobacteriia bacterium]
MITRLRDAARAYPGVLWRLGFVLFINVAGLSFIWPITTIYISRHLGRPVTVAGVVLLIYSGASALGQLTGGYWFDRIGARRVVLTGLVLSAAAIALPGLSRNWFIYVGAMAGYGFAQSLVFPAVNALAAKSWPAGGRKAFNFIYVMHNAGVAVGTALGGILASRSFVEVFLATAVIALLAAALVFATIHDRVGGIPAAETAATAVSAPAQSERPIPWLPVGLLLLSAFSCWLVYVQWAGTIAIYMQNIGIPLSAYSLLWTLNGLVIVFGQPVIGYVLRLVHSDVAQLLLGNGLFIVAFGLLLTSQRYPVFVVAMVVLTLGEMLVWPGMPATIDRLAPASRRGFLQGLLGSASTAGRMFGPLLGGIIFDHLGAGPLLRVLPWMLLLPAAGFLAFGWARRSQQGQGTGAAAA